MRNFDITFDSGELENGVFLENRSSYKAIPKKNPIMSNKNCWEINLPKIIQKILVLDLSNLLMISQACYCYPVSKVRLLKMMC